MLEAEVKDALRHISNRKAAGGDDIPIELLKAGGDGAVKVLTIICKACSGMHLQVPMRHLHLHLIALFWTHLINLHLHLIQMHLIRETNAYQMRILLHNVYFLSMQVTVHTETEANPCVNSFLV